MQTKTYELTPVNGRKSFYGKCQVIDDGKVAKLKSYDTIVAEYNHKTKAMSVFGWYSNTTASHINSFLSHFGYPTTNKKGMENWNNNDGIIRIENRGQLSLYVYTTIKGKKYSKEYFGYTEEVAKEEFKKEFNLN